MRSGAPRHERDPSYKPRLKARIVKSFIEDALMPATRGDLAVSRASSRAFHMIGDPVAWLKRPAIWRGSWRSGPCRKA